MHIMQIGLTDHIDGALVALYLFWAFFFWLVLYLQQEGRREGFPLVSDPDGKPLNQDLWMPTPKQFTTADGRTKLAPDDSMADTRPVSAEFALGGPGSPLVPTGDPLRDSIGPGSFTARPDVPDVTFEGHPRIVPMRVATDFSIAEQDIDPRGAPVHGADGHKAGTVQDVWVDRSDFVIRYLEVELDGVMPSSAVSEDGTAPVPAKRRVLVPWNMVDMKTDRDWLMEFAAMKWRKPKAELHVHALLAEQFSDVPQLANDDRITYLEEENVMAFFGAGYLYATADRGEPLL